MSDNLNYDVQLAHGIYTMMLQKNLDDIANWVKDGDVGSREEAYIGLGVNAIEAARCFRIAQSAKVGGDSHE